MKNVASLRKRITIRRLTFVRDADGWADSSSSWTDIATVWGSITPVSGLDRMKADQPDEKITHKVLIRDPVMIGSGSPTGSPLTATTITSRDTLTVNGTRSLVIKYVTNSDEGKIHWLELGCLEGDSEFPG